VAAASSTTTLPVQNATPRATSRLTADEVQGRLRYVVEKDRVVVDDLPRRFLEAFAAILRHSNYRQVVDNYARITARCGNCAGTCQIFDQTGDPRDVPCYRSNLLLEVYRRHFTLRGLFETRVLGREYLDEERILEMASTFYDCTACRRCSLECPLGLDHGLITHLGRYVLSELGLVPRALVISVREQLEGPTRNTSAIPLPAILDSLAFLADEIRDEKGCEVAFPVDKEDREYIFFPAVSDYLMEAETLMGIAVTLHAAGDQDQWTIGSRYFDGINYGLFYSDWILERVLKAEIEEAQRLRSRRILIGECGHASRTAKAFAATYGGASAPPVVHILEYTYAAFKSGRLRLKPDAIAERVTYHDPCNIARSRWIIDQPREILRAFCADVVEMTPRGQHNLCCGGGGGTVSVDELRRYRTSVTGARKAEQLRATGAKYVVAPCANCKKQLREVCEDHGLDMQVVGLHDLIYRAIVVR
jgi:Fe-S oxidoreductase